MAMSYDDLRAELNQARHERDWARAEAEKLRKERDEARGDVAHWKATREMDRQTMVALSRHIDHYQAEAEKLRKERDHYKAEAEGLRKAVQFAAPLSPCTARSPLPEVFQGLETIEAILTAEQRSVDPLVDASVRLSRIGCIVGRLIAITRP